jgi:hypothetical protein
MLLESGTNRALARPNRRVSGPARPPRLCAAIQYNGAVRPEFEPVFAALKQVLAKFETRMTVIADEPGHYALESKLIYRGKPIYFAGVKAGKAYVSFHLMPLYMNPKLHATISPELKMRMQGKSCFNFKAVVPEQLKELERLTSDGLKSFEAFAASQSAGSRVV